MKLNSKVAMAVLTALAAQSPGLMQGALAAETNELTEVIVTATRQALNVQQVTAAITAISGDNLEKQNIEGIGGLTATVPNVLIAGDNGGTTGASLYMRGIPNVGVYLDGIWQVSNSGLLTRDFLELDRLEVLRGPQGTLYGRDSTGGSIQIHSKKPGTEFGGVVSGQIGSLDRRDLSLSVDLPITDTLLTKFSISDNHVNGWVKSLITGVRDGYMDSSVMRADILWKPLDNLELRYIRQKDSQEGRQARVQARIDFNVGYYHGYQVGIAEAHDIASGGKFNPMYAVAGYPGGKLGKYESWSASTSPNRQYNDQNTLHIDWDVVDNLHVKYMYGDSKLADNIYNDWGGSQYNFFVNYYVDQVDLKSHELQLSGKLFKDKVDYVVGAYKWDQSSRSRQPEWSMQDWVQSGANNGTIQTLDYAKVLASASCKATPKDRGYNFTGQKNWLGQLITGNTKVSDWIYPCDWAGGNGWIGVFSGVGNTSDRLIGATQDGKAYFGEATWHVTDEWDVTFGYRHHSQDNQALSMSPTQLAAQIASGATLARPKQLDTLFSSISGAVGGTFDKSVPTSFSANTKRFATKYTIRPGMMVYAQYSEGFNSGGVSLYADSVGPGQLAYEPELLKNYEVGLRADWLDRTLRTNLTAFRTDWLGIQYLGTVKDRANGTEVTELVLQNAADGRAQGLELESTWLVTDRLQVGANLGYLKTEYLEVKAGAPLPKTSEFARAPSKTASFNAQYSWSNVFGGELTGRVQTSYFGCYWRASTLELRQDFQGLVSKCGEAGNVWFTDARFTWEPASKKYEIAVWGKNLTDTYNYNSGFMHGIWQFDFATVDRPREYGVQLKARF